MSVAAEGASVQKTLIRWWVVTRACRCRLADGLLQCCACEETTTATANPNEIMCVEFSSSGMVCCCLVGGASAKVSCCPRPLSCLAQTYQCLCCFGRCAFPCNEFVPFELGCCGVMCIDKQGTIVAAHDDLRAKLSASTVHTADASVYENRGAPAIAIDR